MAIPTNIKTLLSGNVVEWARIEFKETWDPEASLKTVCAFANDLDNWGGGYIVVGAEEENGRPVYPLKGVPVEKIDAYQKNILEKSKSFAAFACSSAVSKAITRNLNANRMRNHGCCCIAGKSDKGRHGGNRMKRNFVFCWRF